MKIIEIVLHAAEVIVYGALLAAIWKELRR